MSVGNGGPSTVFMLNVLLLFKFEFQHTTMFPMYLVFPLVEIIDLKGQECNIRTSISNIAKECH